MTSAEKQELLSEIIRRVESISARRRMKADDTQAITESIKHLLNKK